MPGSAASPRRSVDAEMMRDPETGGPHTSHTTNPVPVLLMGGGNAGLREGRLADVAPALLELMDLPQPQEMTGHSLLHRLGAKS
jgi:2,3-bisphosphoglycerate-independent phosphoglycerate mutase